MEKLKVAILGAGGIGKYHVREFFQAGAEVSAILDSDQKKAEETAEVLFNSYKIRPKPYSNLESLLEGENLGAISICTPPQFHYEQVKKCLEAGVNVLCEKPLVQNSESHNAPLAEELVELARAKKLILCVNTQWPSLLEQLKPFVDLSPVYDFSILMQPLGLGKEMLLEQLSHMNSLLVNLMPNGRAEEIKFSTTERDAAELDVHFKYSDKVSTASVQYQFRHKKDRPRDMEITINEVEFKRTVGDDYLQKFVTAGKIIDIEDPFRVSIGRFVGALSGTASPLVSGEEMIENMILQDRIVEEYLK